MSNFHCGVLKINGAPVGESGAFPAMRGLTGGGITARLDEDDGLFIGYGLAANALPYSRQDCYGSKMEPIEFQTVELENEFLRATFLPQVGGRLWSLYDKRGKRDLIHRNVVFKPGNFAIRNAWVAGGVEWNFGRRGHDALTCSPLFTAKLHDADGTPVLRFYEFSRTHGAVCQMDFLLPEGSRFLLARMRVVNPNPYLIPMYFWSNIAVTAHGDERVIVPAETTFANTYVDDATHELAKLPLPDAEGFDCTRPALHPVAKDHFFNIPADARKFVAVVRADGRGVIHASTSRLQGRKLFVWGQSRGGRHWQRMLTAPGAPGYIEIQAGLAKTQLECLPMPPRTAWEWMEAYGALECDASRAHGGWGEAKAEAAARLEELLPDGALEAQLRRTHGTVALRPAEELLLRGSGWGALENLRRPSPLTAHLDFGETGAEQAAWRSLLETGSVGSSSPASWITTPEWHALLKQAVSGKDRDNWRAWYHLAVNEFCRSEFERAELAIERSLELEPTVWGLHAKANILRSSGRPGEAAGVMEQALRLRPGDESLAKEALNLMNEATEHQSVIRCFEILPEAVRQVPMIRFQKACALAKLGDWRRAEELLRRDGGLQIPDIREGENSLSELYLAIRLAEAGERGESPDPASIEIPFEFDLRMNHPDGGTK